MVQVRIMHEVRLLEQLDHGNIISFFGSWVNRDKVTAFCHLLCSTHAISL